jgi:hypothetical protein
MTHAWCRDPSRDERVRAAEDCRDRPLPTLEQCIEQARVAELEAASGGGEQPRGWLTGEEREAVQWAADAAYDKQHPAEDTLRNLLARSTPPEVVLPNVYDHIGLRPVYLRADVIEALAAAGVEVKEVGK